MNSFTKLLFIALSLVFLLSCGKKEEEAVVIPPGILNEEQLTKLLTDFALAESAANMNIKSLGVDKADSAYAFDPLYDNNVSEGKYDSSIAFYIQHPDLYKKVYDNVLVALSELESKRNGVAKDSISK